MIVGVDSGAWSAYAVLDFNGHLVAVNSRKNWSRNAFLRELSAYSPAIISCDTNPPTKSARKTATFFSARLFYPHHSLTLREKNNSAASFKVNAHERDALASAIKAFNSIASNKMRLTRLKGASDKTRALVLQGMRGDEAVKAEEAEGKS